MTHNKLKTPTFLKHDIYHTVAITGDQQASDNFHGPMLHRHKKPLHQ